MFENPRRGRQAKSFTTNVPKILDLKSSSEQIFFRKLSLGAPAACKESRVRLLGASGFCYRASRFCSLLARWASAVFWEIQITEGW